MCKLINRNTIVHPKCFNIVNGRTNLNKMHQSIQQSLRLIIATTKGELLGDPNFGSNLSKFIYETNCNLQWALIEDDLKSSIEIYEKRITVDEIVFSKPQENTLNITIRYELTQMDDVNEITFSVLLPSSNGGRNNVNN